MKYRPKLSVIEAFQVMYSDEIPNWAYDKIEAVWSDEKWIEIAITDTIRVDKGDWIIKGENGEIYSCKNDIFENTYEPVPDQSENTNSDFWKPIEQCPKDDMKDYLLLLIYKNRTAIGWWYNEKKIFCLRNGLQLNDNDIAYYAEIPAPPNSEPAS